jgi:hypothetical protein
MDGKRTKTFGNLLMGIRFSSLMKLIIKNGISITPVHLLRLVVLIPTSLLCEIFTLVEKIKYNKKIRETRIEKPPIFIIGHWRSGTTLLHQLASLDSRFTTPSFIQTVIPDHFLFSTKYWVPVIKKVMPPKRPMDEVEMGPLDPMEDEWALIRLEAPTPFVKVFFPFRKNRFITGTDEFVPTGESLTIWKEKFMLFLKKITLFTGKQIILKNPFHTPRISILTEMFPGAKYIHIIRNPLKIVPSAINMWNIVVGENAFRRGWESPGTEATARLVEQFRKSVDENRKKLAGGSFSEVRYEDLEKDPVKELKRIYGELEMEFSPEHEEKIIRFMEVKKNYRKNIFNLSQDDKEIICRELEGYMKMYGYEVHNL